MNKTKLPEWVPTSGYIRGGRMRGRIYTIRKPTFHIKDRDGRIVGAIQTFTNGDDGVIQIGKSKPDFALGYGLSNLTNYGKGIGKDAAQHHRAAMASYLSYALGPKSPLPQMAVDGDLLIIPIKEAGA